MDNYLAHHGVKGQRWGFRRYQNSDGTLTNAGRKRYGSQNPDGTPAGDEKKRDGYKTKSELDKKIQRDMFKVKDYTEEELDAEIKRLEKEVRALDLNQKIRNTVVKNKQSEKKQSELAKIIKDSAKKLFVDTTVDITAQAIKHCLASQVNVSLNKSKRFGSKKSTDSDSDSEDSEFKEFVFANNKKK